MNFKEIAKYFSGLVTGDLLCGLWLYTSGDFPVSFYGWRLTGQYLWLWLTTDLFLIIVLVYYAWFSKGRK